MVCYVPFNSRNLDISFLVFKPTVVIVGELVEALKHFSLWTESLGCLHSSIFQSLHGNMIIWYGAWLKRSKEKKELLNQAILSCLTTVSSMAILTEFSFFDAYAGESKDGSPAAKFSTGDTVSICAATHFDDHVSHNIEDLSYAVLAMFKSRFLNMDGAVSGICLKCNNEKSPNGRDLVLNMYVWKSLQCSYSYILNSDIRTIVKGLPLDIKYDIFRVVYVTGDYVQNLQYYTWPPHRMLENEVQSENIVQD